MIRAINIKLKMIRKYWLVAFFAIWFIGIFHVHLICFGALMYNLMKPPYTLDARLFKKVNNQEVKECLKQYHKCRLNYRDISYEEYQEIERL